MDAVEGARVQSEQDELERAVARLLVWGFSSECIAAQTGCSLETVQRIRLAREQHDTDADDVTLHRLSA